MVADTHQTTRFAESHHHLVTTSALVILFWVAAAGAVGVVQTKLQPVSPAGGAGVTIAVILLAAYGYTRCCARCAGITHALGVGIAWLMLGITAELVMVSRAGHEWSFVLGSPARPLLRNVFFFVWIFAPALFARREEGS